MKNRIIFMFDVDGVIIDTPHEKAWKKAMVLKKYIPENYNFTKFYLNKVAGEPGIKGATNILVKFSHLNKKNANLTNLSKRFRETKQNFFEEMITKNEFNYYNDIVNLIEFLHRKQKFLIVVSSSENAKTILSQLKNKNKETIISLFNILALGTDTHWNASIDKINHYAMAYGKALAALESRNEYYLPKIVVFEDAPRGISMVKKLGFVAIGISRYGTISTKNLKMAGADLVLTESVLNKTPSKEIYKMIMKLMN